MVFFLKKLFYFYVSKYFYNKKQIYNEKNRVPSVYLVVNSLPFWDKSIGSHLRVLLSVIQPFIEEGHKVTLVFINHPYMTRFANSGVVYRSNFRVEKNLLQEHLFHDIRNISGIENINIEVLFSIEDAFNLKNMCETLYNYFAKVNENDLIIILGGKVKSNVFEKFLPQIKAKKVYILTGRKDSVTNIEEYSFLIGPKNPLNIEKNNKYKTFIQYKLEPFYWQLSEDIKLVEDELSIIKKLEKKGITKLVISVKQKISTSFDDEYINTLKELSIIHNDIGYLFIGDKRENILPFLSGEIFSENILTLEFSNHLYTFFKELNKNFSVIFTLPRINGNGGTNMIAAVSGIPVVLYKGSDAEGVYIPKKYFVDDSKSYLDNCKTFLNDNNAREKFVKDMKIFKKAKKEEAKKLYLGLL